MSEETEVVSYDTEPERFDDVSRTPTLEVDCGDGHLRRLTGVSTADEIRGTCIND